MGIRRAQKKVGEYLEKIGIKNIFQHEQDLLLSATEKLKKIEGLKIIGTAKEKTAILSFVIDKIHPLDIATMLDLEKIAIRSGHHCAQPAVRHFNLPATCRVSFGAYNDHQEIDRLEEALKKIVPKLRN